jgi:hypothetical protein
MESLLSLLSSCHAAERQKAIQTALKSIQDNGVCIIQNDWVGMFWKRPGVWTPFHPLMKSEL